jgi:hypothetical protein
VLACAEKALTVADVCGAGQRGASGQPLRMRSFARSKMRWPLQSSPPVGGVLR